MGYTPWQGWGTVPARSGWGVPEVEYPPVRSGWGYPRWGTPRWDGVPPARSGQGYPRWGIPCRDGVTSPLRYRTADGVLDTPRSVCLLSSRRRNFLLFITGPSGHSRVKTYISLVIISHEIGNDICKDRS